MAVNQPSFSEQCQRLRTDTGGMVLRSASTMANLIYNRSAAAVVGSYTLSDADDYNYKTTFPTAGTNVFVIPTEGLANIAFRPFLWISSGTLTAVTDTGTIRFWGARPINTGNSSRPYALSGAYFGEIVASVAATTIAINSEIRPASGTADTSYCDVITATAGNPHPGISTAFGSAGGGRHARFDMLGYPLLVGEWTGSGITVGVGGEYWQY